MSSSRADDRVAFERAFALMDRIDERTAERLEPTPFGPVVVHTRLNRVHDLNFLRAEQPGEATAEELAAEAERVQGAAGIGHRRVNVRDEGDRKRLEPEFVRLGWKPETFVLMVHRRGPDRPAEHEIREVTEPEVRPLWAEAIRNEPHGKDETLVPQILEHLRAVSEAMPTHLFAAEADGKLVAHTALYSHDGVGQVENVVTLPKYRGRGLARALVQRAVAESKADGNDLTFLVADADDWPQRLYEKLGFETVGRYARFLKQLVPASAGDAVSEALKSSPGGSSDPPGFHSKFQVPKAYGLTWMFPPSIFVCVGKPGSA